MRNPEATRGRTAGYDVAGLIKAAIRRPGPRLGTVTAVVAAAAALVSGLAAVVAPTPPVRSGPSPTERALATFPAGVAHSPEKAASAAPTRSDQNRRPAPPPRRKTAASRLQVGDPGPMKEGTPRPEEASRPSRQAPEPAAADPLERGRELFTRQWRPNDPRSHGGDGLGPVYNADSCLACHYLGGPGGAGPAEVNVTLISSASEMPSPLPRRFTRPAFHFRGITIKRPVNGQAEWAAILPGLGKAASVLGVGKTASLPLHHFGVDPSYAAGRSALLELANDPLWKRVSRSAGVFTSQLMQRNTPPLFGLGLIDSMPDPVLLQAEAAEARYRGIQGRVHRLKDGRIGRFGWKAEAATLDDFVRSACANELGLEVPGRHQAAPAFGPAIEPTGLDLNGDECDALSAYIRGLSAPIARSVAGSPGQADIERGRRAFEAIGCAVCHTPSLGGIQGIYSDLLLHNMGPSLASLGSDYCGVPTSQSGSDPSAPGDSEWRTPPLWGLAASAPYLHDGRARTIEEAIAAHGAQGETATTAFFLLTKAKRAEILAFLNALAPPPTDHGAPANPPDPGPALAAEPSVGRWRHDLEAFSRDERAKIERQAHFGVFSKLQAAKSLEKMGKRKIALEYYHLLVDDYPDSDEASQARKRIAALGKK